LISGWILLYVLVTTHKDFISKLAITQINKEIKGTVRIGDLAPDFFHSFPYVSARLSDVFIRDSLWAEHHHDFIEAKKIYVCFHFLSLLRGKPDISKVIVVDASIYLFTDECGYCNLNRNEDLAFHKGQMNIPDMAFENTRIVIENKSMQTLHDIEARRLSCHITNNDSLQMLHMSMNLLVHGLGFNLEKGSYLKEKSVDGKICLIYDRGNKIGLDKLHLNIDRHPFIINGNIFFKDTPNSYEFSIETKKIHYRQATGLLTAALRKSLDSIDIAQPFDVSATIAGQMAPNVVPNITTHFSVTKADMETPAASLGNCSYTGNFNNHIDPSQKPGDENSTFIFNNFRGNWSGISISSSRIEISNLKHPIMACDVKSVFDLEELNRLSESSSIQFRKGTGNMDITYSGPLINSDTIIPLLNGTFSLEDAEVKYLPRNLIFENCCGELEFRNEDLIIKQLTATVGRTDLAMTGNVLNLLALININPEQLTMEWNISTPNLNLNDFISYIGEKKIALVKKSAQKNKIIIIAENMDRLLSDGTAKLNVTADKMIYKKFEASHVEASVVMIENKVILQDVHAKHAAGTLGFKGTMINGTHSNHLNMECHVDNVNIPEIFYAFDNFGQDAITSKNMKGNLTAKIMIDGVLMDNAKIKESSMKGNVDFTVTNGELINFEPAMKIAVTAFKKRDFSHIHFADLTNTLELNGSAITVNKMEIRSNVVILFVEGIYDTKKGTDMSIQVPVSNLSKTENEILENTGRVGLNIRLRAKTGEDGKLKVSWDPFNKARKQRNEVTKSNAQ
jgi:hypothetical protein